MRVGSFTGLLLSMLTLASAPADADEGEIRKHVDGYFRDFNQSLTPEYLAEAYLSSPLTIVSSAGVRNLSSPADVAGWLRETQAGLARSGWVRSELLEGRVCMADQNVAVFSMRLARHRRDGSTVLGATYTLFKSDRWRIVTVMIASPDRLLRCDTPS